jgi:hypothetical protein
MEENTQKNKENHPCFFALDKGKRQSPVELL